MVWIVDEESGSSVRTKLNSIPNDGAICTAAPGYGTDTDTAIGTGVPEAPLDSPLYNTWIGANVGADNDTGNSNTAVGTDAMQHNVSGTYNVAVGDQALQANTTGSINTAVGATAMIHSAGASNTVAIGENALASVTGNDNVAIGQNAASSMTTGHGNIIIGKGAESGDITGDDNIVIGRGQNVTDPTAGGQINIGGILKYDGSAIFNIVATTFQINGVPVTPGTVLGWTSSGDSGSGDWTASPLDAGANVNIIANNGGTDQAGGTTTLKSGDGGSGTASGGSVELVSGNTFGDENAGTQAGRVELVGGSAANAGNAGGDIVMNAGLGGGGSGGQDGQIFMPTIPTADPHQFGAIWNSSGVLHVSTG